MWALPGKIICLNLSVVSETSKSSIDIFCSHQIYSLHLFQLSSKQQRLSSQSSLQCNTSLNEDFTSGWPWEEEMFWSNIQDEDTQHLADANNQKGPAVTLPSSHCWQVLQFCSVQPNNLRLAKEYLLKHYPLWVWRYWEMKNLPFAWTVLFYYLTFRDVA